MLFINKFINRQFGWGAVLFLVSFFLLSKIFFAVFFHTEPIILPVWELFFYVCGIISGAGFAFSFGRK